MNTPQTVFIVDDDLSLLRSLSTLLTAHRFDVRSYNSTKSFLDAVDRDTNGCLVTDVHLPGVAGIQLPQMFTLAQSALSIVLFTAHPNVALSPLLQQHGAVVVAKKPYSPSVLVQAVRNGLCLSQKLYRDACRASDVEQCLRAMSGQELDIISGMISGKPIKNVSLELGISMRTVDRRRADILRRLEVNSVGELGVLLASHMRLIDELNHSVPHRRQVQVV
jgi:FixJ family two-component response regulator